MSKLERIFVWCMSLLLGLWIGVMWNYYSNSVMFNYHGLNEYLSKAGTYGYTHGETSEEIKRLTEFYIQENIDLVCPKALFDYECDITTVEVFLNDGVATVAEPWYWEDFAPYSYDLVNVRKSLVADTDSAQLAVYMEIQIPSPIVLFQYIETYRAFTEIDLSESKNSVWHE